MPGSIEHVVVIVKENHTFDNYFGTFPGANGVVLPPAANPPAADPTHTHYAWTRRGTDTKHRVQYKEADIPEYFALARRFTLCDNFFAEVAGPSTPSHCMIVAADAPVINNPASMYRPTASSRWTLPCIPDLLTKAGKSWGAYGSYVFGYFTGLATKGHLHERDTFLKDVAAGKLSSVSFVYGDGTPNLSEHPVQNVSDGCKWTASVIAAIGASKYWATTMIVVTWDDWGGWYDHVTPPNVEKWDPTHAQHPLDAYPQYAGQQWRYGSRVPCLVVGPYAKRGHVSHQLNSHASIPRLIEDLFSLPHLNTRDASSNGLSDCYDLTQTPNKP
jgi:phospholipase C